METERPSQTKSENEMIKLFKNTKGYNWEIRLLEIDLDRLEKLNTNMINRFGSGQEQQ